jgi:hypothetical protein
VLCVVNGVLEYLEAMQAGAQVPPLALTQRPDGQWVATVWPRNMIPAFFPGFRGEVWLQPGKAPTQAALYRHKQQQQQQPRAAAAAAAQEPAGSGAGGVSVVLGECCGMSVC